MIVLATKYSAFISNALAQIPATLSPEEQNLIAQMTDIQLPEPVGFWPPSLGLCLIFMVTGGLILSSFLLIRKHRHKQRYRRAAQGAFINYSSNIENKNASQVLSDLNTLAKRCCITGLPASKRFVAKLWGQDLYLFLIDTQNKTSTTETLGLRDKAKLWAKLQYASEEQTQSELTDTQEIINDYLQFIETWIKHHSMKRIQNKIYEMPSRIELNAQQEELATA